MANVAFVSASVISLFGATIEQMVALAVLMPVVASLGGNAGTQTMTVAVRALATRELHRGNAYRVLRRELLVGILNGLGFAVIIIVSLITPAPKRETQELVEHVRYPNLKQARA